MQSSRLILRQELKDLSLLAHRAETRSSLERMLTVRATPPQLASLNLT